MISLRILYMISTYWQVCCLVPELEAAFLLGSTNSVQYTVTSTVNSFCCINKADCVKQCCTCMYVLSVVHPNGNFPQCTLPCCLPLTLYFEIIFQLFDVFLKQPLSQYPSTFMFTHLTQMSFAIFLHLGNLNRTWHILLLTRAEF